MVFLRTVWLVRFRLARARRSESDAENDNFWLNKSMRHRLVLELFALLGVCQCLVCCLRSKLRASAVSIFNAITNAKRSLERSCKLMMFPFTFILSSSIIV